MRWSVAGGSHWGISSSEPSQNRTYISQLGGKRLGKVRKYSSFSSLIPQKDKPQTCSLPQLLSPSPRKRVARPTGKPGARLLHLGTSQCCSHYCSLRGRAPSETEGGRARHLGKLQNAPTPQADTQSGLSSQLPPRYKKEHLHLKGTRGGNQPGPRTAQYHFLQTPGAPCGGLSLPSKSNYGVSGTSPAP